MSFFTLIYVAMRRVSILIVVLLFVGALIWWLVRADVPPQAPTATSVAAPAPAMVPYGAVVPADTPEETTQVIGAAVIDLDELRADLPDNLYWSHGVPTEDPIAQQQRLAERTRRNTQYGKILSGTATDDEIAEYYAYRERLSRDYIAFAKRVLERYGEQLTEEERGLYGLSIDMHGKRLQELPRAKQEAYARKQKQDDARAAWRQP